MAAGEKFFVSDIKLAGYLKLLDNPIYLGLSDDAYINTNISDSSLDIINLTGGINISSNNVYLNTSLISSPGLFKYQGNYHGLYDNRTLVDKEYVDLAVTGGVTAGNGLTESTGPIIELGGPLTQDTDITGNGTYSLSFGTSLSRLVWGSIFANNQISLQTQSGLVTTQLVLNTANTSLSYLDAFGNGNISIGLNGIVLTTQPTSGTINYFRIRTSNMTITNNGSNNRFIIQDDANFKGMVYWADYSANFTPESLVSKRYVDDQISLIGVSYWDLDTTGELVLNPGVPGPVIPHTTNLVDLGSNPYKWRNIYLQGFINQVNVNNAYTLPTVDGSNGQVLKTNGAGVVTWQNDSAASSTLADLTDVDFISGTPVEGDILVYNGTDWEARELPVDITVTASSTSNNNTNRYLDMDGSNTLPVPFILPDNCKLKYLSLSCSVNNTWTAEVHVNGSLVPGAVLTVTSSKKAWVKFSPEINFNAGDEVQLYLNGINISRPRINAIFTTIP